MVNRRALWLLLLVLLPRPLVAERREAQLAAGAEVEIVAPTAGVPTFGAVRLHARISSAMAVARVEFWVDGELRAVVEEPPYSLEVEVGQENLEHRFEVVAYGSPHLLGRAVLVTPRFQVDEEVEVELQQLFVTVIDGDTRVLDLGRGDFRVRDNGREQEIVTFASGDIPFSAVLLIDASGSMRGERLEMALEGAAAFTEGMGEKDEAKVMVAAERLRATTPFSRDAAQLRASWAGVEAGQGTAIRDHLFLSLLLLERRLGRRVVILLSDGWDAHSVVTEQQLSRLARRSQALVYWVRVAAGAAATGRAAVRAGEGPSRWRAAPLSVWRDARAFDSAVRQLERAVRRSGGRIDTVPDAGPWRGAFRRSCASCESSTLWGTTRIRL